MDNKRVQKICFKSFVQQLREIKTNKELITFKLQFVKHSDCLGIFKDDAKALLKNKELVLTNNKQSNIVISQPTTFKPLKFDLKGLNKLESNINKLNDFKLKYEFEGLFNLLSDECNLLYNPLWIRQKIIKDLNKFKSLKFFKIGYISRFNLKKEYRHLTYKNGTTQGYSKIYFIKNGLYVIKTLEPDNITLKVFYVGNRYKTLLNNKSSDNVKVFCPLKEDKFNLSSIDAYKVLDKKDNIRYYSYCNKIGLDRKNRQLLKDIRKSKKISRDSLIESLENKMEDLKDNINNKVLSETDKIYLELQFQDCEKFLSDLKSHDEDNSMEGETILDDYF